MPRKTTTQADSPILWEADQMDLQNHMDSRLGSAEVTPAEPGWFAAAFDASWAAAFAAAASWAD